MKLLQLERAAEEVEPHERRLAALPGERDGVCMVGLDQLPDVLLEDVVRHPKSRARVEGLLVEEEAVRAAEIADRSRRLRHHVEARRNARVARRGRSLDLLGRAHALTVNGPT